MNIKGAISVMSPLDVMSVTISEKQIVKKKIPDSEHAKILLPKVKKFISLGEYSTRNPTYWNVSAGKIADGFDGFDDVLYDVLQRDGNLSVDVTDLDNNNNVVEASCDVILLVINCKELTDELIKEIKCAQVHTAFGPISLTV